jgi:hypothetical protein
MTGEDAPPPLTAAKILADALLSSASPAIGAATDLAASGRLATEAGPALAALANISPTQLLPLKGYSCGPAASSSPTLERAVWLSPKRLTQTLELEASKLRAEADAVCAVKAAFEFMAKHSR